MNEILHKILVQCKRTAKPFVRSLNILDSSRKKAIIHKRKKDINRTTIKVGLLVQMPEVWDKLAPLYEEMTRDKRFEAWLIIVPKYDFVNKKAGVFGKECEYFLKKYPECNYLLYNENDSCLDNTFDYVFYQRCWEEYLPKELRCNRVIKKAMTCYVPYCYHGAPEKTSYYQTLFFRYLTNFYCCSIDQRDQVKEIGHIDARYMGFPLFDSLHYNDSSHNNGLKKVLWTPRWTDEDYLGGSNFFEFKDEILELANNQNVNLVLRPHPLTFDKAVRDKKMTIKEVEDYKNKVLEKGASFDNNAIVEDTFADTDILITDFSSIIISFFLSGRPIIYCGKFDIATTDVFSKIIDVSYKASNCGEIEKRVNDIINGMDPLKEKREKLLSQLAITQNSVKYILDDLESSLR